MNYRVLSAALLAAAIALVPALYLWLSWPSVLAFVPMHFDGNGIPNRFVDKEWLWNIAWMPAIAFLVLTFLPQVRAGESIFWSSSRQRLARLVVVSALALDIAVIIRTSTKASRATLFVPHHQPQAQH